jgi:nicotinate-nucleotide adenylyltransferase
MTAKYNVKKKTGILGGTFDPVHCGHINLAVNLHRMGLIDQTIFVPTARPPHKLNSAITTNHHRLAMLRLALANYRDFHISDYEINHDAISYTIHTASHFAKDFGNNLYLLLGMDSVCELHTWYKADKLVTDFQLIIYCRPNYAIPGRNVLYSRFGKANTERILTSVIKGGLSGVSSSLIRNHIREGKDVSDYLPSDVIDYITKHKLYGK